MGRIEQQGSRPVAMQLAMGTVMGGLLGVNIARGRGGGAAAVPAMASGIAGGLVGSAATVGAASVLRGLGASDGVATTIGAAAVATAGVAAAILGRNAASGATLALGAGAALGAATTLLVGAVSGTQDARQAPDPVPPLYVDPLPDDWPVLASATSPAEHDHDSHDHGGEQLRSFEDTARTPGQGEIDPRSVVEIMQPDPDAVGPNEFKSSPKAELHVPAPTGSAGTAEKPIAPNSPGAHLNNDYAALPGDMLPDLTPLFPNEIGLINRNGRVELAFNSTWANVGKGPLELRFQPGENTGVRQRVYNTGQSARDVNSESEFLFDTRVDHRHQHLNDFARYELFTANADGTIGERVAENHKVSFMITDTDAVMPRLDPQGLRRVNRQSTTGEAVQGISVGWADTYGATLDGQSFDVSRLPAGNYVLRLTFDPNDRIAESDETNNSYDTLIKIGGSRDVQPFGIGPPRT